jgi:hypothetical protein
MVIKLIIYTYRTVKEALLTLKLPNGANKNISSVCHKKRNSAYGYKWKYIVYK